MASPPDPPAPRGLRLLLPAPTAGAPWRFAFDGQGRAHAWASPVPATGRATTAAVSATPAPLDPREAWIAFEALLAQTGLTLERLAALGILPLTVGPRRLREIAARIQTTPEAMEPQDVAALVDLATRLDARLAGIGTILLLAAQAALAAPGIRFESVPPTNLLQSAIDALARYVPLADLAAITDAGGAMRILQPILFPEIAAANTVLPALQRWMGDSSSSAGFAGLPTRLRQLVLAIASGAVTGGWSWESPREAWDRWEGNAVLLLKEGPAAPVRTDWSDVVHATAGRLPGAGFRASWAAMTAADWAWLCAMAVAQPGSAAEGDAAPPWALLAGLAALGFDLRAIDLARETFGAWIDWRGRWAGVDAPGGEPGRLLLMRDGPESLGERPTLPRPPAPPIFPMRQADRARYAGVVAWLMEHGLVREEIFHE